MPVRFPIRPYARRMRCQGWWSMGNPAAVVSPPYYLPATPPVASASGTSYGFASRSRKQSSYTSPTATDRPSPRRASLLWMAREAIAEAVCLHDPCRTCTPPENTMGARDARCAVSSLIAQGGMIPLSNRALHTYPASRCRSSLKVSRGRQLCLPTPPLGAGLALHPKGVAIAACKSLSRRRS